MKIKIASNKFIGEKEPVFIIAEVGINHNGNVRIAKKMVSEAKKCGADAVKFQTFRAEEFVGDKKLIYKYRSGGKTVKESMYGMFKRHEFTEGQYRDIFNFARRVGIIPFSTPSDTQSADLLIDRLGVRLIKIASDDMYNLDLLKYIAKKGLPIIISTGMATLEEIKESFNLIKKEKNNKIIILHCVSLYPTPEELVNLNRMVSIKNIFKCMVGFSDHSDGNEAALASVCLGAKVIEKHFTLDKNMSGPDHRFSADPLELENLVNSVRKIEKMIGDGLFDISKEEMKIRRSFRRSIVAAHFIKKGEKIKNSMLAFRRPGSGHPPKSKALLIGRIASKNIKEGELLIIDRNI